MRSRVTTESVQIITLSDNLRIRDACRSSGLVCALLDPKALKGRATRAQVRAS